MRIGTDIIEIDRIKQAAQRNHQFPSRILAPEEMAIYTKYPETRKYEFLAGRFSAKEAYSKALQTGIGTRLKFTDICILPNENGAPYILNAPLTKEVHVSISHSKTYATSTVIINLSENEISKLI